MNNGEDLKNTVETSMQHAEDRERFKRTKTISRVLSLDECLATLREKPLFSRSRVIFSS